MFDIFGNKKKQEVLQYIDHELLVVKERLQPYYKEYDSLCLEEDNLLTTLRKLYLTSLYQKDMARQIELVKLRKEIERIYS